MPASMKQLKEALRSPYRGSEQTYEMVKEQIAERWGEDAAEEFDPHTDAMPFSSWLAQGYAVKKGSKALKSITIVEMKDPDDEKKVRKIRRTVCLFHKRQVQKIQS